MSDPKKKSQRTDKNGRPYPAQKSGGKKKPAAKTGPGKAGKPNPAAPTEARHPADWFFLHREDYPVERLKAVLAALTDADLEVWPALQVMELTFPHHVYIDFECTDDPLQEPALQDLLKREAIRTVWYVSVEPYCSDAELAFLQRAAEATGGLIAADNEDLLPLLRGDVSVP